MTVSTAWWLLCNGLILYFRERRREASVYGAGYFKGNSYATLVCLGPTHRNTLSDTHVHLIIHKHTRRPVVCVPVSGSWAQAPALVPWCWADAPQWAAAVSLHQWPAPETPGRDTAASATAHDTHTHTQHIHSHKLHNGGSTPKCHMPILRKIED